MHVNELNSLNGKCAVIIGGAGKIGFPIAEALAEAGARVYIASTNKANVSTAVKKLQSNGLEAIGLEVDQSSEVDVLKCINTITSSFRTPDILVNCGVERPMQQFFDDTVEAWDRSMIVNSRGLFVTCRAFANSMALVGGGAIINIASIYGLVAPDPKLYEGTQIETEPDYPYTKGGMIMFSKFLAARFAKKNVRVNVIAPGGYFNDQGEPFLSQYCDKVPLGRMADHDDLKGIAVFLASRASQYITGVTIPVDGGFTLV